MSLVHVCKVGSIARWQKKWCPTESFTHMFLLGFCRIYGDCAFRSVSYWEESANYLRHVRSYVLCERIFMTFCLGCYSEVESNSVSTFQVELQHFISMRETQMFTDTLDVVSVVQRHWVWKYRPIRLLFFRDCSLYLSGPPCYSGPSSGYGRRRLPDRQPTSGDNSGWSWAVLQPPRLKNSMLKSR
jgi:hypothetical protein